MVIFHGYVSLPEGICVSKVRCLPSSCDVKSIGPHSHHLILLTQFFQHEKVSQILALGVEWFKSSKERDGSVILIIYILYSNICMYIMYIYIYTYTVWHITYSINIHVVYQDLRNMFQSESYLVHIHHKFLAPGHLFWQVDPHKPPTES